jgi:hypothetical protein
MSILNQIKAKNKTQKVIESCLTTTHLECAERMVELYHQKYEDFVGYNQLKRILNQF